MNANDREYMGTPEAAKEALIAKARSWREYRQPMIATAKEHKRIETLEREAKFQLANAALLWLWHEENPQAPPVKTRIKRYGNEQMTVIDDGPPDGGDDAP